LAHHFPSPDPERVRPSKGDDRQKIWKKTSMLIWQKIADHRYGNVFMKPVKEEGYTDLIRQPMYRETVKSRIREGV
ncbi:hypothetical protein BDK51DRAFT_11312, partial [Blyttiomyces helicus]